MKICLSKYDPNKRGGGWTFSNSFVDAMGDKIVGYEDAEIYFIAGPTLATHDEVAQAKADGKKIVLRVDNHLLPSRNRNTGMSRMRAFAEQADLLVYQSEWARDYLSPILGKDGKVILNGVDTSVFYPGKNAAYTLYVRSSRINEKGWEMARYWYSRNRYNPVLAIVGKFSRENLEYKFDFINNESHVFLGELDRERLAGTMRSSKYFLYSYFMDACSNTLLEARASGCEIIDVYGMLQTGGAPEIMACEDISLERMIKEYTSCLAAIA